MQKNIQNIKLYKIYKIYNIYMEAGDRMPVAESEDRRPRGWRLRGLAARVGWPSLALITGLVRGMAKARDGNRT